MSTYTYTGALTVQSCIECGTPFGIDRALDNELRKNGKNFYCPLGHSQHYIVGKTDAQKLAEERERARLREEALKDQLHAAEAHAESERRKRLKDRIRISNGVCPCCNRTFANVLRHMQGEHPEYVISPKLVDDLRPAKCSCGRSFATQMGLHRHQTSGRQRTKDWYGKDWTDPSISLGNRHLTTVDG